MLIERYTPSWIENFISLKAEIECCLIGIQYQIEHIGSTAVPNLDSKPIIDIDIICRNKQGFEIIKSRLVKFGYYHNGDQGIENREVFKRDINSNHKILDIILHHLYVCFINSKALERHIFSRNFLRKNDWARLGYQSMKYALAEKANQNKNYMQN